MSDKKLYIILTRGIVNVGGAEIYTRNRLLWLRQRGYEVVIISTKKGKVYIKELDIYNNCIIPELANDPYLYSQNQRISIINKIIKLLSINDKKDEILIESQTIQLSIWGELLAYRLKARNFCLLVDDRFPELFPSTSEFFKFKLARNELAGISTVSMDLLFKNTYKVPEDKHNRLVFHCSNSIEDCPNKYVIEQDKYDVILGSFMRMEKVCVQTIYENVLNFADKNPQLKILFIFIGGADDSELESKYSKMMSGRKNLFYIDTGIIFPVSRDLVNKIGLFINISGGANATIKEGIPTLAIELETGKPICFLGLDQKTMKYNFKVENYISESISDVLQDIYINHKYNLVDMKKSLEQRKTIIEFSKHDSLIKSSIDSYNEEYYDFHNYMINLKWKIIISFIYGLFGIGFLDRLMLFYRKYFRKK